MRGVDTKKAQELIPDEEEMLRRLDAVTAQTFHPFKRDRGDCPKMDGVVAPGNTIVDVEKPDIFQDDNVIGVFEQKVRLNLSLFHLRLNPQALYISHHKISRGYKLAKNHNLNFYITIYLKLSDVVAIWKVIDSNGISTFTYQGETRATPTGLGEPDGTIKTDDVIYLPGEEADYIDENDQLVDLEAYTSLVDAPT